MKTDELAFFNQQLALMLRDGIPLEGALKQLTQGMRHGVLRTELESLEADLGQGTAFPEALSRRKLPEFYTRMLAIGAASNDLPGMLTLLADHYQRAHAIWTRLKGLMTYPLIVIFVSLTLTVVLSVVLGHFLRDGVTSLSMGWLSGRGPSNGLLLSLIWVSPALLAMTGMAIILGLAVPRFRSWLRWRLPAFREASLAQLASALALMLRQGTPLPEALTLAESLEAGSPAAKSLQSWRELLAQGQVKLGALQDPTAALPPLFVWMVKSSRENPAAGFQRAADLYQARAAYRTELLLYGALPVSMLVLGQLVFWQIAPVFRILINFMNMLGDSGM